MAEAPEQAIDARHVVIYFDYSWRRVVTCCLSASFTLLCVCEESSCLDAFGLGLGQEFCLFISETDLFSRATKYVCFLVRPHALLLPFTKP